MLNIENYFPIGLVTKEAFIGRKEAIHWLSQNIQNKIHTLILAPRRYGKSSLALMALKQMKTPYAELDLQLCRSASAIEAKLIHAVETLISDLYEEKQSFLKLAETYLKKSHKKWDIGLKGLVHISIEPNQNDTSADNIITALELLDLAAQKVKKLTTIFIDEIQEITELDDNLEIQGAIRHFAQKSQNVCFIFSGSNRRLLIHMFDDSKMPLYQLCDKIILDRIPAPEYHTYIQKVAVKTWGQKLNQTIIDTILATSQRHPRRTYNLCLYLWRISMIKNKPPTQKDVHNAWEKLLSIEVKGIRSYLAKLSTVQLKTMAYIAQVSGQDLRGKQALRHIDASAAAITKALQVLEDQDLVGLEDGQYFIIDPAVRTVLEQNIV